MSRVFNGVSFQQTHLPKRIHLKPTDYLSSYPSSSRERRVGLQKDITMVESEWNKDPYRKELVFKELTRKRSHEWTDKKSTFPLSGFKV